MPLSKWTIKQIMVIYAFTYGRKTYPRSRAMPGSNESKFLGDREMLLYCDG